MRVSEEFDGNRPLHTKTRHGHPAAPNNRGDENLSVPRTRKEICQKTAAPLPLGSERAAERRQTDGDMVKMHLKTASFGVLLLLLTA